MVKKDLAATNKGQKEKEIETSLAMDAEQRPTKTGGTEGESKDGPLALADNPATDDEEDVSSKAQIMVSTMSL
jgi:hypothetical protein